MVSDRNRDPKDIGDDQEPQADTKSAKVKLIIQYAKLGFAPFIALVALVVALISYTNNQSRPEQAKIIELTARIDSLNASLSERKGDLDNLRIGLSREKSIFGETTKKLEEHDATIIKNINRLQLKLKVTPTIDEQLKAASAVNAVSATTAIIAAPSEPVTSSVASTNVKATEVIPPAPKTTIKKSTVTEADKTAAQTKALKAAIEKFNKN